METTMRMLMNRGLALAAIALAFAAPAAAQQQSETEFESWRIPGWSFTPGIAIGITRDTNVALASPGDTGKPDADSLLAMEPSGSLEFFSPRSEFSAGYRGYLRRYMEVDELNGFDQRAQLAFRHQATRRLTLFARNSYMNVPTTDEVFLNGLPFVRTGSRTNAFVSGAEMRLTKFTNLNGRYDLTWVDFDNEGTVLTGGWVNGFHVDVAHRFTERATFGGEYSIRFADLNEGTRSMRFNDAGAIFAYTLGPHTTFSAGAGISHLADDLQNETRTAPYFRAAIVQTLEAATVGAAYERSFVPSFGFGGSNESQEVRGYVHMPIPRNRAYVQASLAWRRSIPYIATDLDLDSILARSTLGYALARWFRLEGFYSYSRQTSREGGGEINRHRVGAQLVISQPMRIQ
jgi:hypothetical protein